MPENSSSDSINRVTDPWRRIRGTYSSLIHYCQVSLQSPSTTMAATFFFLLSVLLLLGAASSSKETISPVSYWNKLLPKTPIPKSLHAFLPAGSTDPSQSKYASSVPFDRCSWQEYKHGATLDEVIQGGHGLRFLFLEQNLKPGSKTKKLDFEKKIRWPTLIPRKEAEAFPFSTSKLGDILKQFKIDPNSATASKLRQTLKDCEREPDEGETSFCATSLESLADFAVSQLKTDDIQLLTYSFVNKEEKDPKSRVYTVQHGVVELASRRAVACHIESYPYAVFYCHTTVNTKTYIVPLIAEEDGTRLSAGAVCHIDTTSWNPKHATMLALGIKPGTPVCHFLSHGHFMFVPNSASEEIPMQMA
ncbi:BURP domain-containing protein 5-like [Nymphaea colorata]|uniref:BURP domain-containing protein 5-like n=1 Tax=Nymphaea colorata TaxID=210225 RepID=UPI00214F1713|nr:BURP domain-containing protein 5-like [Nymphaea colorata]